MQVIRARNLSVIGHSVENWVDPSGRRWQRASLGDCAAGYLILGSVSKPHGVDLYWRGRGNSPKRALFSDPLDALLQDSWERMSRKSGRHQMIRVAGRADGDVGTWWLALLPSWLGQHMSLYPNPYIVEQRLGGGAELFRLLPPAIRRPRG